MRSFCTQTWSVQSEGWSILHGFFLFLFHFHVQALRLIRFTANQKKLTMLSQEKYNPGLKVVSVFGLYWAAFSFALAFLPPAAAVWGQITDRMGSANAACNDCVKQGAAFVTLKMGFAATV